MKTQSPETSLKVELKLIELIRQASISKRFNLVCSMARTITWVNMLSSRNSHLTASERDATIHFVSFHYGPVLAELVQANLGERVVRCQLQLADLVAVMSPAIATFEQLAIPYHLISSVASSP